MLKLRKIHSMKYLLFISFIFLFSQTSFAKSNDTTYHYRVLIEFKSICCGTPNEAPLLKYIKKIKRDCHIKKIVAYKISPLGKEGEYDLGFPCKGMSSQQKRTFITGLKKIVPTLKDKGTATILENYSIKNSELPVQIQIKKITY